MSAAPYQAFWTVLGSADATGKRLICQCVCGRVAGVAADALATGGTTSCGCRPLSPDQRRARHSEIAEQRRRDLRAWRPRAS
jgi:hypothetical protein